MPSKLAHFGPKRTLSRPLWAQKGLDTRSKCVVTMSPTQTGLGGPRGTRFGPDAPYRPAWVGHMVTTHFDLVSSPFWAHRGRERVRFGPKCASFEGSLEKILRGLEQ